MMDSHTSSSGLLPWPHIDQEREEERAIEPVGVPQTLQVAC